MQKLTLVAFAALTFCIPLATHAADGTPLWTNAVTTLPALAPALTSARNILVDTNGNSYVTGYYINAQSNADFLTVKYLPNGVAAWARLRDGGVQANDVINAMALDGAGDIYVAGNSPGAGTGNDFLVVEYSPAGSLQHQIRYNSGGSNDDFATALAIDVSGEVFVGGQTVVSTTNSTWKIVKLSSTLTPLWTNSFSGAGIGFDQVKAIAADTSGGVYVTGYAMDVASNFDYATVKYSSAGTLLWVNKFHGASNGDNLVQSVALDNEGNTYVTGIATGTAGSFDYATIKISSTGQGVWTNIYDGPNHSDDEAVAVALDSAENVYVTGTSIGAGGSYGYTTIKYSNAGVPAWTNFFNGIGNRGGQATGFAVDGSGNAYVTGTSFGGLRPDEFVTVKYATGGAAVWTNLYSGGTAAGVVADINGNAYVTGNSSSGVIATIEYSAAVAPLSFVTTNGNFGPFNNHFVLSLTGPAGSNAVVSATTNFQNWVPIATNQIPSGALQVTDTLAPNNLRFYRAQLQ
ncbi:MAG TPA: SBBP repeat-containing protein [Verrucomicrobiae bacterium]|jgi:hypothetical protein|nr:SBBP repeat-containing protein [Verrucomicrobiae bacterium]